MGLLKGGAQAGLAMFSDRRLKKDIKKLGRFSEGINWHSFRYADESPLANERIGFMADEVQERVPEAVSERGGYMTVDYGKVFNATMA